MAYCSIFTYILQLCREKPKGLFFNKQLVHFGFAEHNFILHYFVEMYNILKHT